ncbi:hypothetical protein C2E23DRAFT_890921 [Lenzites betulinus]|nr:hypothetical protein C2E23DRAFT_890921 [Lenzites betulinus]
MSDSDLNTSDCAEMLAYPDNAEHRPLVDYSWNAHVPRGDPPPDVDRAVIDNNAPPHETTVQEPVPARLSCIAAAWHGGDYEGAHGVVLSVHNTGTDNESFPSAAQVKFRKPLNSYNDTFAVPVFLLRPVQPDAVGQHALIVGGEHKGDTVKLLEEVSGGWFVDAAYDYFDVESEDLVRMFITDAGE